jgi:O-antigen/teichoic acid export membrane protein
MKYSIISTLKFLFKKDSSTNDILDNKERYRRVALTSISGAVAKVFEMIIPLITVRLLLAYLGKDVYGLYTSVLSLFALFQFADFGLGSGLKTALSSVYGAGDKIGSKKIISSTFFFLLTISFILLCIFLIIFPYIDWSRIVNVNSEETITIIGGVVFAIVLSKVLQVPLSLVQRIQLSLQEGYKYNIWSIFGSFLSLISIFFAVKYDVGKANIIWISTMIIVVVLFVNLLLYFLVDKKELRPNIKYVETSQISNVMKIGVLFFVLSVLTAVGLAIDNFIVANILSLEEAATYGILSKLTKLISGITIMIAAPLWTANADALVKKQYEWVYRTTIKMSKILLLLSAIAGIVLIILIRPFMSFWLDETLDFSLLMVTGMVLMQITLSFVTSYFMVLNSMNKVKIQILLFLVYTPIVTFLKFYLGSIYGMDIIPWIGVIGYILMIVIPTVFISLKEIKKINII